MILYYSVNYNQSCNTHKTHPVNKIRALDIPYFIELTTQYPSNTNSLYYFLLVTSLLCKYGTMQWKGSPSLVYKGTV
jgi:hypothetical protein